MSNPLREAKSIQQKLLSSKETIKSVLSYNKYRKDNPICSNKELEQKLVQIDKDLARTLDLLGRLERDQRQAMRNKRLKGNPSS